MPETSETSAPPTPPAEPAPRGQEESAGPPPRRVHAAWLALLATPVAAGANSPVLILPDMAGSLGTSKATAAWFVTTFAWAMAVGTPLMAGLLRRHGVRPTLRLSAALVAAGTVLVAVAPWLPLALAGRAAQAAGGAGLVTLALSLGGTARRMGVITSGFGVLGATGPLLGSWLGDTVSWRLALAVSAVALLAVPAVLRSARDEPVAASASASGRAAASAGLPNGPFDARGAALLTVLASSVVLIPRYPAAAVPVALVLGLLLVAHSRARPDGFVPRTLVRTPAFLTSALLACALSTSYFTLLFAVPEMLDSGTGWSTATIGTGQLTALLAGSVLSWLLPAAASRMGRPAVLTVLIALGALAPITAVLTPWAPLLLLVATMAVFATAAGNATLASYAVGAAPEPQRPTAIGLFTLCYQLGGAFGPSIAVLTVTG
ncbi:MFS transporter [Streptomyces sp. N2-109]|uniref:Tetracycline resistance protein n=1 Tax=Streptomyces gossypii TaxID=2883101 RepID=A0ABT2JZ60_9ACTN|nr:MFS transporter [Streptomyces gossypii]MCT2593183.1 MFS transporter [Streptomyces gossypii]